MLTDDAAMTDATIDSLVTFVRAAEIFATTMNIPVSHAVGIMLKAVQAMNLVREDSLAEMISPSKTVS
jgi:hypothetical protein